MIEKHFHLHADFKDVERSMRQLIIVEQYEPSPKCHAGHPAAIQEIQNREFMEEYSRHRAQAVKTLLDDLCATTAVFVKKLVQDVPEARRLIQDAINES